MFARLVPLALAALLFAAACEKTNHDSIDKWTHTQQGPAKLMKAFADESLDPDLSAHAGANMIKKGKDPDVKKLLEQMSPGRRTSVIGKLAPRLWDIARVEGEMQMPGPSQIQGKDALVMVRKFADEAGKAQIDTYLVDWYGVSSYEGRAQVGATLGASIVRMIGPPAGKKLMRVADGLIAAPGQDKVKNRLGDELLLGLAASGDPDAVKYVLDIVKMKRGDETLATRAMTALYKAYVDPQGLFELREPGPLLPNLDAVVGIAKDDGLPGAAANDAVALIRVIGPPQCLPALIGMIAVPHANPRFKYVGANNALKCGGTKAIKEVVRALPDGAYDKEDLVGAVAGEIARMSPRAEVLAALRELIDDKGKMPRWVAIEALAAMKSAEDAPRIAAIKSSDRLLGFWGDEGKPDPTLGQRAKELADQVGKAPK